MYVYEAIEQALAVLNTVMIPATEAEKMTVVKSKLTQGIRSLKAAVANTKTAANEKKEETPDDDHDGRGEDV